MRTMLKSKIHRARITGLSVDYEGSIAVDKRLMDEADLVPYEQVQVFNINNGARFTTYVIEAPEDSGEICINGAAARLAKKGDIIIILSYVQLTEEQLEAYAPKLVYVDKKNTIKETKSFIDSLPF
jgi:aspartate 1-decarboxylase